jgi:hypothetical protein
MQNRISFPWVAVLRLSAIGLLSAMACFGQGARGAIMGVVTDDSGSLVPAATVRAVNVASNVSTTAESNSQGNYTLELLYPGDYRITASKEGFKTVERTVTVRADDRLGLDIRLEVGAVTEKVVVEAGAPLLETETSSVGTVIDHRRIQDLPLIQGNPFMLEMLATGVIFNGNVAFTRPFDGAASTASINGSATYTVSFQLDGVADNWGRNPAYTPSVEFIQEYKVQTASYDASEGHSSSAWVDIALKSGTNQSHGSAYYYFQNPALNANLFFNNKAGQPKPDFLFNRFGGGIGGPIRKDKTFFFFGYERIRHNLPSPAVYTVPTDQERKGDFSSLLALGSQYQIYDPATIRPAANGRYSRDPFAGNVIPSSRLSSIAQKILGFYPEPNQAGSADAGSNFNFGSGIEPDHYYSISTRADQVISDKRRFFGRVVISKRQDGPYRNWAPGASGNNLFYKNRGGAADHVYSISPNTVLNLRYGYTRFTSQHILSTAGFDMTSLGFPASLKSAISPAGYIFPRISPSNYSSLDSETPDGNFSDIHSFYGSVSRTIGMHTLKAGVDFRIYLVNNYSLGASSANYSFGSTYTNGPLDNSPASARGQDLASMLLGIATGGSVDVNDSYAARTRYAGVFLQDDWKVTRKLTVNLGLRWEYEGPIVERYTRSVGGFDYDASSPIEAQVKANYAANPIPQIPASQFQVKGGLLYAGVGGVPNGLYNALNREFAPRVGFAYSFNPKTVLRAGYGIFFDQIGITTQAPIQTGYNQQTTLVPSNDNGLTFIATLANPFPSGLLKPVGNSQGLTTFLGKSISFVYPTPSAPYTQRWSIGVQRELAARLMIDVSYVGSRGTHLLSPGWSSQSTSLTGRPLDFIPLQYLSPILTRDQATINRLTANVPNPFYPLLPGTSLSGTTVALNQLLMPYPQFTGVTAVTNDGFSWYHSLQTQVQRRFSNGFTAMGSFTWSKNMEALQFLNNADARPSRAVSPNDRPLREVVNGIYELPFGKGKRIGSSLRGVAGKLAEGWQLNVIYERQSGDPLGFGNFIFTGDASNIAYGRDQRSPDHWFNISGFDRNTADQLSFNIRYTSLRFSGVRGDGISYLNFSVVKKVKVTEKFSGDIRCEFFNALNHTVFSDPDTTPTSSTFGMVTSSAQLPRTIQFGAVMRF